MNYQQGFLRLYAVLMVGSLAFELWDSGGSAGWFENWLPFGVVVTTAYLATRWIASGLKR